MAHLPFRAVSLSHAWQWSAAFGGGVAASWLAAAAAPAHTRAALCTPDSLAAAEPATALLLAEYCASSVALGVAHHVCVVSAVLTAAAYALHLLISDTNVLLKKVLSCVASIFALFSATFWLTAAGGGRWNLALPGPRPFVQLEVPTLVRWTFLFPATKAAVVAVDHLLTVASERAAAAAGKLAAAVSGSVGDVDAGGVDDVVVGSAAAADAAHPSPYHGSTACARALRAATPDADTVMIGLTVAGNAVARCTSGGLPGFLWSISSILVWAAQFAVFTLVSAGSHRLLAARPLPSTPTAAVAAAAAPSSLASPKPSQQQRQQQQPQQPPPPALAPHARRYARTLRASAGVSAAFMCVSIASELVRTAAPLSRAGLHAVLVAEAAQFASEVVYQVAVPLFRVLCLALEFQERRDEEAALVRELGVVRERAAEAARVADARVRSTRQVFHELRQPLGGLSLALEELAGHWGDLPPSEVATLLALCRGATASASFILDSVLAVAAMEAGAFAVVRAPADLRSVLAQAAFHARPVAELANAAVTVTVDDALPPAVAVDATRLTQALTNLLQNALDKVPRDGTGRVRLSARLLRVEAAVAPPLLQLPPPASRSESSGSSGSSVGSNCDDSVHYRGSSTASAPTPLPPPAAAVAHVRLEVADNGPGVGVPLDQLLLQTAAARASSHSSPGASGGSVTTGGLGLTLAREVVVQHGGTLVVDSTPGGGATLWAELPLAVVEPAATVTAMPRPRRRQPQVESSPPRPADGSDLTTKPAPPQTPSLLSPASLTTTSRSAPAAASPGATGGRQQLLQLRLSPAGGTHRSCASAHTLAAVSPTELAAAAAGHSSSDSGPLSSLTTASTAAAGGGRHGTQLSSPLPSSPPQSPQPALSPLPPPTRLLIVDDVATNRLLLARQLQRVWRGVRLDEADNGAAAVDAVAAAAAEGAPYDGVLLDGVMPVMDGAAAARAVRAAGPASDALAIVGVTANALQVDRASFLDAGADDVVTKPAAASAVVGALEGARRRRRRPRERGR